MYRLLLPLFLFACFPLQAAISYVDKAETGNASATFVDITVPAHQVDDLIIAFTASDGIETHTVSGTETWNNQTDYAANAMTTSWAWAIATGTSSFTATFTCSSGEALVFQVVILRGADTTDPIGVSTSASGTTDTPAVTQTTGTISNSWAVAWAGNDRDRLIVDTGWPTNTTGLYAKEYGTSGGAGLSSAYDTTGGVDSESYTWSAMSAGDGWYALVVEILDATPPASTRSRAHVIGG